MPKLLSLCATIAVVAGASTEDASAVALPPTTVCPGQLDAAAPPPAQVAALQCVVNRVRASRALRPVRLSPTLARSARLRADAIVRCRQFSHTPCGESFATVFRRVGYLAGGASVGETLAWSSLSRSSPRNIVAMWLASTPHRRVLLTGRWRELGAVTVPADGVLAPGPVRLVVAQFGRR